MFPDIEFNKAAFRHNITEETIRYVMQRPLIERLIKGYRNKWMIIGYDSSANLIEICYNVIDENTVNVFHAMPCRKSLYKEVENLI